MQAVRRRLEVGLGSGRLGCRPARARVPPGAGRQIECKAPGRSMLGSDLTATAAPGQCWPGCLGRPGRAGPPIQAAPAGPAAEPCAAPRPPRVARRRPLAGSEPQPQPAAVAASPPRISPSLGASRLPRTAPPAPMPASNSSGSSPRWARLAWRSAELNEAEGGPQPSQDRLPVGGRAWPWGPVGYRRGGSSRRAPRCRYTRPPCHSNSSLSLAAWNCGLLTSSVA